MERIRIWSGGRRETAEREASIGLECYIDSRRPSRFPPTGGPRSRLLVVAALQDLLIFRFHGLGPLQGPFRSAMPVRGIRPSVRGIHSVPVSRSNDTREHRSAPQQKTLHIERAGGLATAMLAWEERRGCPIHLPIATFRLQG